MEKLRGHIALQTGADNPALLTRYRTFDATDQASARDLIDQMHAKARQGAGVRRMLQCFPEVDEWRMVDWMRTNFYIRNRL